MSINGGQINGMMVNGEDAQESLAPDFIFTVTGYAATVMGVPKLQPSFPLTLGLDEAFSPVGMFMWTSGDECKFEPLVVDCKETTFMSIRDDQNMNRPPQCGVSINHICVLGA